MHDSDVNAGRDDARAGENGDLTGEVALVTGGGRGIGRATALALARRGARVMAVSRTRAELDAVAAEHAAIVAHDVSLDTADGCRAALDATREALGPPSILVCNAGVGSADERPLWEQEPALWHASMALNLHAPFELMRRAARDMIAARHGRIVVVASTAGLFGSPSTTAYCAAKHGVIGLVRAAALDLAPYAVTCNAVNPGWVRTVMSERSAEAAAEREHVSVQEIWRRRTNEYAAGRLPTVEEVAETICFLSSPGASGISGEAISVALGDLW
ncbi:MAG TPA: SDR family NAD(P)-dependent oxidoreductase [Solirubrobacteraceae bacterium]|nr:SDR family NAD(P)-dependent oxidoreductase [Solirubrobacteraceae bacterium]